ncbi:Peptidyl-Lys metalloendopeptidase [Mycena venus]|uniref:Peptidyl-Lys metalloendopeptidase n=1 Tax=Mycena venus TaxID=2733690 RepID=A0A8H6YHL9_9AGAR|nr:Peptidyl-Lys metalloendopeptidase [Mycena venus]
MFAHPVKRLLYRTSKRLSGMAFRSLFSTLVALAVASAASAAPSLSLSLSRPKEVSSIIDLQITAALKNTGDVELKLLKDPRTVLHTFQTNTFSITNAAGDSPAFTGAYVKYVPSTALAKNLDTSFVVLAPGAAINVTHDLSKAYNFTSSGHGSYSLVAGNEFQYIDPATNSLQFISANMADATHTTVVSGQLAIAQPPSSLERRIKYTGCTADQQSQVSAAADQAQKYAHLARVYLNQNRISTPRFVTWFGKFSDAHHKTIHRHFINMATHKYRQYNYNCNCQEDSYAFVHPNDDSTIHLCTDFWTAPLEGTDSQGGTLVHESSHFTSIAGTDDIVYGQDDAMKLASNHPKRA